MEFPVDFLTASSQEDLDKAGQDYMSTLIQHNPDNQEYFKLPDSRQIPIGPLTVSFTLIYGQNSGEKLLALFEPKDQSTRNTFVALYLGNQWWAAEEILKTGNSLRKGLLQVQTLGERIVVYILNCVVYRACEIGEGEEPFLCHSKDDFVKILWRDGKAVGFYSVKPKGSSYNKSLTQLYQLPVLNSIFVRKCHHRNQYGLQILEDFVQSFREDCLGIKYPLSTFMYQVCEEYLHMHPEDKGLLWEVESVGGPYQKSLIAQKIINVPVKGGLLQGCSGNAEMLVEEKAQEQTMTNIMEEEVVIVTRHARVREAIEDTPVSAHPGTMNLQRKRLRERSEVIVESTPNKINRVEYTEEIVEVPVEISMNVENDGDHRCPDGQKGQELTLEEHWDGELNLESKPLENKKSTTNSDCRATVEEPFTELPKEEINREAKEEDQNKSMSQIKEPTSMEGCRILLLSQKEASPKPLESDEIYQTESYLQMKGEKKKENESETENIKEPVTEHNKEWKDNDEEQTEAVASDKNPTTVTIKKDGKRSTEVSSQTRRNIRQQESETNSSEVDETTSDTAKEKRANRKESEETVVAVRVLRGNAEKIISEIPKSMYSRAQKTPTENSQSQTQQLKENEEKCMEGIEKIQDQVTEEKGKMKENTNNKNVDEKEVVDEKEITMKEPDQQTIVVETLKEITEQNEVSEKTTEVNADKMFEIQGVEEDDLEEKKEAEGDTKEQENEENMEEAEMEDTNLEDKIEEKEKVGCGEDRRDTIEGTSEKSVENERVDLKDIQAELITSIEEQMEEVIRKQIEDKAEESIILKNITKEKLAVEGKSKKVEKARNTEEEKVKHKVPKSIEQNIEIVENTVDDKQESTVLGTEEEMEIMEKQMGNKGAEMENVEENANVKGKQKHVEEKNTTKEMAVEDKTTENMEKVEITVEKEDVAMEKNKKRQDTAINKAVKFSATGTKQTTTVKQNVPHKGALKIPKRKTSPSGSPKRKSRCLSKLPIQEHKDNLLLESQRMDEDEKEQPGPTAAEEEIEAFTTNLSAAEESNTVGRRAFKPRPPKIMVNTTPKVTLKCKSKHISKAIQKYEDDLPVSHEKGEKRTSEGEEKIGPLTANLSEDPVNSERRALRTWSEKANEDITPGETHLSDQPVLGYRGNLSTISEEDPEQNSTTGEGNVQERNEGSTVWETQGETVDYETNEMTVGLDVVQEEKDGEKNVMKENEEMEEMKVLTTNVSMVKKVNTLEKSVLKKQTEKTKKRKCVNTAPKSKSLRKQTPEDSLHSLLVLDESGEKQIAKGNGDKMTETAEEERSLQEDPTKEVQTSRTKQQKKETLEDCKANLPAEHSMESKGKRVKQKSGECEKFVPEKRSLEKKMKDEMRNQRKTERNKEGETEANQAIETEEEANDSVRSISGDQEDKPTILKTKKMRAMPRQNDKEVLELEQNNQMEKKESFKEKDIAAEKKHVKKRSVEVITSPVLKRVLPNRKCKITSTQHELE